jgi:two-component system, OmpR family, response regulator AdeR
VRYDEVMATRRTGTILVVDDDHDILAAIDEVLSREGYRVVAAIDGAEAIAVLAAEPIDLILLDLLMPTMSGWEVIEQRGEAAPPIVVISAAPKDVVPGGSVRAVLQKPFVRGELLATVAAHVRPRG